MLRLVLSAGLVVSLAAVCAGASGCTSLLGDFEVGTAAPAPLDDAGPSGAVDGATGTLCGGQAVDLQTSAAHCGKCDNACKVGEACQAGACVGSRPAPEFASTPRTPTGWRDVKGDPIGFTMKPTGLADTIYECRSGPESKLPPNWSPCDGKQGAEPKHLPQSDASVPEGTYRLEYRYRAGDYASPIVGYRFYTLFKLDKTATCPRPGVADDGPRYADADYFTAADTWSKANAGQFPLAAQFPAPTGDRKTSPIWLENPFIKIPFSDIEQSSGTRTPRTGFPSASPYNWPAKGGSYVLNERSVRRTFRVDPQRRMLLVKRQYVRPQVAPNDPRACRNELELGSQLARKRGPVGRGPRQVDCEAWVFNTKGQALCFGQRSGVSSPVPLPIDRRPPPLSSAPAGPAMGHTNLVDNAQTLSVPGSAVDLVALFDNQANPPDAYIWLESGAPASTRWWKVASVFKNAIQVEPNTSQPVTQRFIYGCKNGANTGVCKWQYTKSLSNLFVVPTGFVKLHERQDHAYALGLRAPGIPSKFTKCETPGCNAGNLRYLTFLPP